MHENPAQVWKRAKDARLSHWKNLGNQSAELEKVEAEALKFGDSSSQNMMWLTNMRASATQGTETQNMRQAQIGPLSPSQTSGRIREF